MINHEKVEKMGTLVSYDADYSRSVDDTRRSLYAAYVQLAQKVRVKDTKVFTVFLVCAILIVFARSIAPFQVEKDQALQLEAAQRLVEGRGLTTTSVRQASFDLSEAATAEYVTWFTPGFSLMVAGWLSLGVSLLISLKFIYGLTTLIGWIGWAIVASHLLSNPMELGTRSYRIQLIIAALLPILVTPLWQGTDIFLWAGIPFVLLLLNNSDRRESQMFLIAAGILVGFLISIRYGSIFLVIAAFALIAQRTLPNLKALVRNTSLFLLGFSFLMIPLLIYTKLFSKNQSLGPEYISPSSHYSRIPKMIFGMLKGSYIISNLVLGSPVLDRLCRKLDSSLLDHAVGIPCLLIILFLPLLVLRRSGPTIERPQRNIALSLSFFPIALVIFLIGANVTSGQGLFGVTRYYTPVSLCGALVFYQLASRRGYPQLTKLVSGAIVAVFIMWMGVYMPLQAFVSAKRTELIEDVLGFTPSRSGTTSTPSTSLDVSYPEFKIFSRKENSRLELIRLHISHPEALFLVLENYPYYIYDEFQKGGPVPGTQVRRLEVTDLNYWKSAYTSKPIKVFWVLDYPSASVTKQNLSFIPDSNLKPVYTDKFEKTLILESDFPAGYRFIQ
jgi:hypothetical protein